MMLEMKNRLEAINSRLDINEEKRTKLDNIAIGTIQNQKQNSKNEPRALGSCGTTSSNLIMCK